MESIKARRRGTNAGFLIMVAASMVLGTSSMLRADGMMIVPGPPSPIADRSPFPLEVRYHHVTIDINGQVAKTSVDQEFYNPGPQRLEAVYVFPLPPGASINDFSMSIDGKMVAAELLDARKARDIYLDIVRRMRDPALLEYSGQGAFRVRIFPVEPHAGKRVSLSYTEVLDRDNGLYGYSYPLNTEKFSAKPLDDLSITVNVRSTDKIKTLFSPTHEVSTRRRGEHEATVSFQAKNVTPDLDFVFYYDTAAGPVGVSLLTYRPAGEDGYFLLSAAPDFQSGSDLIAPKDITFVLDTSGSMTGGKLDQARRALLFCLENLNPGDRFDLIRFSTEAEPLFGKLQQATAENIGKARRFSDGFQPIGGTNIDEALGAALAEHGDGMAPRPRFIIFITDGKPTIGETDEAQLVAKVKRANASGTRIFTFGIGDDLNTHLLDRITEETRAYRTYVRNNEDLEVKISGFYQKIKSPVLVDVKVDVGTGVKAYQMYPRTLPDLFEGSQLLIFGRYSGAGRTTVRLSGTVQGRPRTFEREVALPSDNAANAFLAPLWATQRIGYLLDQIRLHGENKELTDEVADLARRFGVITPYTSYLILEDESSRVTRNELPPAAITLGGAAGAAPALREQAEADYKAMQSKEGASSVTASREVEAMKKAENVQQMYQGRARLDYTDKAGNRQNLASQAKNVQGRAFYQTGRFWVDSQIQSLKQQQTRRIQFGSAEYFALLEKEPSSAQYLALGQNVRFAARGVVYEIYE